MVSEQLRDAKGVYRTFQGVRYNFWGKRGIYVSQRGGRQTMLHRALWESVNGEIQKGFAVVPISGDWECFDVDQWECRPHANNGRQFAPIHPCVEFDKRRYYKATDCPYFYHTYKSGKKRLLHRDVFEKFHGPIPEGYEVHHKDFDPSNNDSTNLVALKPEDHRKLHSDRARASV